MTIDPQRDTPKRLAAFIGQYHPAFLALTGTPAELENVARSYVVHKFERPRHPGESLAFDHSSYIYLMDRQGTYTAHVPHTATAYEILEALQTMD
jgi:protein SCO1